MTSSFQSWVKGVLGGLISPLVIAGVIAFARIYRETFNQEAVGLATSETCAAF